MAVFSTRKKRLAALLFLMILPLVGGFALPPSLLEDVSFSQAVYDRNKALLRLTLSRDEKYRLFVPLKAISPLVIKSMLLHEDQYFNNHMGVNPASLVRAFYQTYLKRSRKIGASTITMQLARIKYGIYSRNLPGKLWQIIQALRLELHYSKDQILEAYLNLVPYGRNVEGIGAASFIYFGKSAEELNLPESLLMTVIPQSPSRRTPGKNSASDTWLYDARNRLYTSWLEAHPEDKAQQMFFALPLKVKSSADLPRIAPHFVNDVLTLQQKSDITTSLDSTMQTFAQALLTAYVNRGKSTAIANASAMIVDFRTMEVLASVGSADFFDEVSKGQVNGVKARRSPGSALKPFIYALAFDQGLIHPMSLLKDSPHSYGDFNPENFDYDFLGPLSAHDALIKSRNVPALFLTEKLKNPTLYQLLARAGIGKLKKEQTYGLSLALGSAEVTMEELVMLYGALANNGVMRPLVKIHGTPIAASKALFSPEAAFLTLDILKDTPSPYASIMENTEQALPVYWKTGTSNSYRDAWTIGIFGHYILAVWVGDFRGRTHGASVGIKHAAPLFFALEGAIINKEHPSDIIQARAKDLAITRVLSCNITGDINNKLCTAQVESWFIPGKSPIADSGILRRILINRKTGKQQCRYVEGETDYKTVEVWPSDLLALYRDSGIHKENPVLSPSDCNEATESTVGPIIHSPFKNVVYSVKFPASDSKKIRLSAVTNGDSKQLYWFADNHFIGKVNAGNDLFWLPHPGTFTLRVVDDAGRADTRELVVTIAN